MPLTGLEITRLATALANEWNFDTLQLFVSDHLDVDFGKIAPSGTLKQRAAQLLTYLNSQLPPQDRQLLESLRTRGNAKLRQVASDLLTPSYFSPSGDAHDAIVLGRAAFVDRGPLRDKLREFTNPNPNTTRLLVVRGDDPSGKSYSWSFLRHLAAVTVGAIPLKLGLEGTDYTPRQLVDEVFRLLLMDRTQLPELADDPQLAKIDPLISAFKGQFATLTRPYWLVIDDLNGHVTQAVADTVYAMAYSVEDNKPQNLWMALLGYNRPITASELRFRAEEDARFPDEALLARHFQDMAATSPLPLPEAEALTYARLLLTARPKLTKEAMIELTQKIEELGEKLREGRRP